MSPNGKIAAVACFYGRGQRKFYFVDVDKDSTFREFQTEGIGSFVFSSDAQWVVGFASQVILWDISDQRNENVKKVSLGSAIKSECVFAPNSKSLAIARLEKKENGFQSKIEVIDLDAIGRQLSAESNRRLEWLIPEPVVNLTICETSRFLVAHGYKSSTLHVMDMKSSSNEEITTFKIGLSRPVFDNEHFRSFAMMRVGDRTELLTINEATTPESASEEKDREFVVNAWSFEQPKPVKSEVFRTRTDANYAGSKFPLLDLNKENTRALFLIPVGEGESCKTLLFDLVNKKIIREFQGTLRFDETRTRLTEFDLETNRYRQKTFDVETGSESGKFSATPLLK